MKGCDGCGQVFSVLAFNYDDMSSNPTQVYNLYILYIV